MMTITLNDLNFEAFHGVHDEEHILGNNYTVNCSVSIEDPVKIVTGLEETIDYQVLFKLIKKHMKSPVKLLETLCMKIEEDIHRSFPQVIAVEITVKKHHPPINGFSGNTSVLWQKKYS